MGAATLTAALGDLARLENPRPLTSSLSLAPGEYARGERRRQGALTAAGNTSARRALTEGARASRDPAKVSRHLHVRLEQAPKTIQDIGWKAQVRLCQRCRALAARGDQPNQVVVAVARELAACIRALARAVPGAR